MNSYVFYFYKNIYLLVQLLKKIFFKYYLIYFNIILLYYKP